MRELLDSRGVYAQSSDIKSRTYLEYRKDMKKKAIAELETREWLEEKLKRMYETENVQVVKSGGDSHIWFLRKGGTVSGELDYKAFVNGSEYNLEFQYTDRADLDFYDFKVSKVGKKQRGKNKRLPHNDRLFFYIIKPSCQFALFTSKWIMENGREESVPAWGSRPAFRIPAASFKEIFESDESLVPIVDSINKKNQLLDEQSVFIAREKLKFSSELQAVVDREEIFKIIPRTMEGFYRSCFILDNIGKYPDNLPLWLVYGTSLCSKDLNSYQHAQLMYSLDYFYARLDQPSNNELKAFVGAMKIFSAYIEEVQSNNFQTSADLSPREEVVNFLFLVNLYEDLIQELRFTNEIEDFLPVNKIFQSIKKIDSILNILAN